MYDHTTKNLKLLQLFTLLQPIFVCIALSYQNNKIITGVDGKDIFIPLSIILIIILNFKKFLKEVNHNLVLILYILILTLTEYIFDLLNSRVLIERINITLFITIYGLIRSLNPNSSNLKSLFYNFNYIVLSIWIISWILFEIIDQKYFLSVYPYDYSQYGAFLVYFSLLVISENTSKIIYAFNMLFFLPLGYFLYVASESRLIFCIMFMYLVFKIEYVGKTLKKVNPICGLLVINLIYFLILFFTDYGILYEYSRKYLISTAFNEFGDFNYVIPPLFSELRLYSSHNQIIELYRTIGIPGLVYFLWFLNKIYKENKNNSQFLLIYYSYVLFGLVVLPFTHPFSYCIFAVLIIINSNRGNKFSERKL